MTLPTGIAPWAPDTLARWNGTPTYIADEALKSTVSVAIALGRPLLVKGEPGTGKTLLTLAAALTQVLETKLYTEIIILLETLLPTQLNSPMQVGKSFFQRK